MEKMNKAYVGTVEKWSTAHLTNSPGEITSITFKDGTLRDNPWPFEPHEDCYLVKKSDLDAYEARIEQLKLTSVWNEKQLLRAKVKALEAENANLRDINKSLGEANSKLTEEKEALGDAIRDIYCGMTSESELMKENEKLTAEVADLNKRISHLNVILEHDENRMAALITENNKLRGTCNELNATVAKLRQDLAKFYGEHTVEFLYEKHEDGKHFIGWTEVSGEEYELTFLTPERKIHE